jgi:DNA-binding NtrC family response regulator
MTHKRILLVEDSDIFSALLLQRLAVECAGYEVKRSASVEGALLDFRSGESPSLVITDLQLEGSSGMDLIRELRACGYAGPIIISSGHLSLEIVVEAARLGVARILVKPFALPDFRVALRHGLCVAEQAQVEARLASRGEDLYWIMKETIDHHEGRRMLSSGGESAEVLLDRLQTAAQLIRLEIEQLAARRQELRHELSTQMNAVGTPVSSPEAGS